MNKHEACPNCPSSDAYWVYPDGHGYCFSCKTVTRPSVKASVERAIQTKTLATGTSSPSAGLTTVIGTSGSAEAKLLDTSSWTSFLAPVAKAWLSKYGLTANEIKENDIYWDASSSGLVFVVDWLHCGDGGKVPSLIQTRSFSSSPNQPKYRTTGKKQDSKKIWGIRTPTLILCEDIVSAIKIGRTNSAKACLGTSLPSKILEISKNYAKIDVWLDPDKRLEALTMSNILKQFGIKSEPIFTKNDPKTDIL